MPAYDNFRRIRDEIPKNISIIVAAKGRSAEEVKEVLAAGATDIGENYVQEAEEMINILGDSAKSANWHLIGHLQTNKIGKAINLFKMVQTIDSIKKAEAVNKKAYLLGQTIPILIEVNIADEIAKAGVKPDTKTISAVMREISQLRHIKAKGLMTMGPLLDDPGHLRPFFKEMKSIFDEVKSQNIPNTYLDVLSMGMSDSFRIAIEEGATMVRIGTAIFGPRNY
ncbi:MAG: YggS family pyridoxal phosphate-dependent enzyme [Candidatus Omnitrophica bacterium]|nr:YggS family pyridoxal phosphate-dependent enzyme [Candidatus Omnitrophota bacterium]